MAVLQQTSGMKLPELAADVNAAEGSDTPQEK
jgi:hypothetical protein